MGGLMACLYANGNISVERKRIAAVRERGGLLLRQ